jgi:outer membrane protein assembly factor BamA
MVCAFAASLSASAPAGSDSAGVESNACGKAGFVLAPFVSYSPETEAALVMAAVCHFRTGKGSLAPGPSVLPLYLAYSQLKQASVRLKPEIYLSERTLLTGEVAYEDWPDRFFGVGPDTGADDEEDYTSRNYICRFGVEHRIWRRLWSGVRYDWKSFDLTETEPDGLLALSAPAGSEGCRVAGLTGSLRWDSRNDTLCPSSGSMVLLSCSGSGTELGGEYTFQRYRLDARRYQGLGNRGVLVLRGYLCAARGDVPFQELSFLGDSVEQNLMRGYLRGRYRDNDVAIVESEYRFPLRGRVGMVLFGGLGNVGDSLSKMSNADTLPAAGLGFRFRASGKEAVNLRLDIAFGEEMPGLYFKVFEAF